jgi:hypothetical protein
MNIVQMRFSIRMRAVTRGSDIVSDVDVQRRCGGKLCFISIPALLGGHGLLLLLLLLLKRVGRLCAEAAGTGGTRSHPALL